MKKETKNKSQLQLLKKILEIQKQILERLNNIVPIYLTQPPQPLQLFPYIQPTWQPNSVPNGTSPNWYNGTISINTQEVANVAKAV